MLKHNLNLIIIILFFMSSASAANICSATSIEEMPLQLPVSSGSLTGTLEMPSTVSPPPVALIIAGSGPTDKNGNNPYAGKNNCLKMLADGLAQAGIASLRYDKRGIGENNFDLSEQQLTIENYIDDADAWIKALQSDGRFSKVIVIGHSEGSLIGAISARQANAAGFISLEGPGFPLSKILLWQISQRAPQYYDESSKILAQLEQGKTVKPINSALQPLFRPSVQPYLISELRYDPAKEVGKLKIPVLLIQGTHDLQVQVDDAKALQNAAPAAKMVIIKNMNHILKTVPDDPKSNIKSYGIPDLPLSKPLLPAIEKFIFSIPAADK
ncbi:alpha/beta hydrolase [Pectinatus frisingensis]|uniref:alpha/beta hydrolase n=1 Tax=Pectinatus frisingensis TaxID=865 RepID=UPI0018C4E69F|nr:alpha/beta hydrolase [Pectinatus frisingensis]